MKTHKVDVVSGYSYPQDKHALWFDESQDVLKKFDGTKWVSGSAASNGDRNYERNFYTKEETVPGQVIWEGVRNSDSNQELTGANIEYWTEGAEVEIVIDDDIKYTSTVEIVKDGYLTANFNEDNFDITLSIGQLYLNDRSMQGGQSIILRTTASIQETLVWNYQDSLPIAMPKCIVDRGLFAEFNELPEAGKAYYFPYNNVELSLIPVLITDILCEHGKGGSYSISGECVGIGFSMFRKINTQAPGTTYLSISTIDGKTFFGCIADNENISPGVDPIAGEVSQNDSGGQ